MDTLPRACSISIHAPLAGRDVSIHQNLHCFTISIHAPLAGRDRPARQSCRVRGHFNPRTPCGVRLKRMDKQLREYDFNPRTPCGVRQGALNALGKIGEFQSTHPLRGATDKNGPQGDGVNISIHAPLAGCDSAAHTRSAKIAAFQSTHPLRGATAHIPRVSNPIRNFNPRTPCGVRLGCSIQLRHDLVISIHAPLAGCDELRWKIPAYI